MTGCIEFVESGITRTIPVERVIGITKNKDGSAHIHISGYSYSTVETYKEIRNAYSAARGSLVPKLPARTHTVPL